MASGEVEGSNTEHGTKPTALRNTILSAASQNPDPEPVRMSDPVAELSAARARLTAAIMSDPSAPGYDRLCANAEEDVRSWELAATIAAVFPDTVPASAGPVSAPPLDASSVAAMAAEGATVAWGDLACPAPATIPVSSTPTRHPARDFSALLAPRKADSTYTALFRAAAASAAAAAAEGQARLDAEWDSADLASAGCPFCDSLYCTSHWAERAEAQRQQAKREAAAHRAALAAAVAAGRCTCELEFSEEELQRGAECELCCKQEELRCDSCGLYPCAQGCCGGCGGCRDCNPPNNCCGRYDCDCEDRANCPDSDGEDEEDRYRRWKADQHTYGP